MLQRCILKPKFSVLINTLLSKTQTLAARTIYHKRTHKIRYVSINSSHPRTRRCIALYWLHLREVKMAQGVTLGARSLRKATELLIRDSFTCLHVNVLANTISWSKLNVLILIFSHWEQMHYVRAANRLTLQETNCLKPVSSLCAQQCSSAF